MPSFRQIVPGNLGLRRSLSQECEDKCLSSDMAKGDEGTNCMSLSKIAGLHGKSGIRADGKVRRVWGTVSRVYLRLIPLHISGDRYHKVGFATDGFSQFILFDLRSCHDPHVAVIVAHELPLGVGPIARRDE